MSIEIKHYTGLSRTPALPLAVQAWKALIDEGHCSNTILVEGKHNALVAFTDNQPAGLITYNIYPDSKELGICIGYVNPNYRGLGIYKMLWETLVTKAKEHCLVHISSATYIGNIGMRATAVKQGRIETQVTLAYDIPS